METPNPAHRPPHTHVPHPPERGPVPQHEPAPAAPARWAPWWVYLVVLLGANYLRAGLLPVGTVPEPVVVVIALVQAAALFALVTAVWRYVQRSRR